MSKVQKIISLYFILTSVAFADVASGARAHLRGDYVTSFLEWKKSAELGDITAQYLLAVSYDQGKGVIKNYTNAAYWYQKSALQGEPRAQNNLGALYLEGLGVDKNLSTGKYWILKAYNSGNAEAREAAQKNWNDFNLGQ
jgi:TPR repeat protein